MSGWKNGVFYPGDNPAAMSYESSGGACSISCINTWDNRPLADTVTKNLTAGGFGEDSDLIEHYYYLGEGI